MSLTYHAMTGDGADFDNVIPYSALTPIGNQDFEWARQGIALAMYLGHHGHLGGAESVGYVTGAATWEAVDATKEFTFNGDNLGGMTLEAIVFVKTENAAQAVQARIRNTTDSSNAGLGSSTSSTTLVKEAVTLTMPSGNKIYRLEVLGGATYAVFASAYLRIQAIP